MKKHSAIFDVAIHNGVKETFWKSGSFEQECLLLACGEGKHPEFAAREVIDTAELAYRMLRVKHFYHEAPHLLVEQLFILKNRTIHKRQKTHPGLSAGLVVILVSTNFWWAGSDVPMSLHIYTQGKSRSQMINPERKEVVVQGRVDETDAIFLLSKNAAQTVKISDTAQLLLENAQKQKKISSFSVATVRINHE